MEKDKFIWGIDESDFDIDADRLHKEACREISTLKSEFDDIQFKGFSKSGDYKKITIWRPVENEDLAVFQLVDRSGNNHFLRLSRKQIDELKYQLNLLSIK